MGLKTSIQDRARQLGFDACRFTTAGAPDHAAQFERWLAAGWHGEMSYLKRNAHKRIDPTEVLSGAKSIIALAVSYHRCQPAALSKTGQKTAQTGCQPQGGQIARYARFADYHRVVGQRLTWLTAFVNHFGGPQTRSLWYVDTGPFLERDLAQRAGLGFIGKHTNLISRKLGNWIFLAQIITTAPIEPDAPERNHCGCCRRCIDACPTGAITAPFELDARRCISYLTIELKGSIPVALRPAIGNRIYGCDDCLAACPWNRFAQAGSMMRAHHRSQLASPQLVELLSLDQAGFREKFAGTPILRAKRRGLLRNVCVALGNCGDASALPALTRAAADPEPLIAEHARWAMEKIMENANCKAQNEEAAQTNAACEMRNVL
jgi:epoxyqueuosine reductase